MSEVSTMTIHEIKNNQWLDDGCILNLIEGREIAAPKNETIDKFDPVTGKMLFTVARSTQETINLAVKVAKKAQITWAAQSSVERGKILLNVALEMKAQEKSLAAVVSQETGKSMKDALGEVGAAVQLAEFFAGEGMRLYGRVLQSSNPLKSTFCLRQPIGVAGLIVAANTPIANVAWKVFPALICGNSAVLKAAEDTPATALCFGKIAQKAGLPDGVLNIVQGLGKECGEALVSHPDVGVISFTGSTAVGKRIAEMAGQRLARISLELGGKNPLVVCDDADMENAIHWSLLSSFSNAGQRCAASSRIIIVENIYEDFRAKFLKRVQALTLGNQDKHDLGPVINLRQLNRMIETIQLAARRGAKVLCGGNRITKLGYAEGYFMEPTVLESVSPADDISQQELFGPITALYWVKNFEEAVNVANESSYGLTAAIHTQNIHRAFEFSKRVKAGTVNVNSGTHGSEPHYPFGGYGLSGNGSREPGVEALEVYSELKNVSMLINTEKL